MFLFSPHQPNRTYGCTVLVYEHSVSLLVYETLLEEKIRIFYSCSKHVQRLPKKRSHGQSASIPPAIYQLLHTFESEMRKKERVGFHVKEAAIFYAPPLVYEAAEEISSQSKAEQILNEKILASLLQKAKKSFSEHLENTKKERKLPADSSQGVIIEQLLAKPSINGYPVREYLGRTFREFSALVSLASIPSSLMQGITDVVHSVFRGAEVRHHSVMYSMLAALQQKKQESSNFVVCGILSDVSLLLYASGPAPIIHSIFDGGERHFIANLAHRLSVSNAVAQSYTEMYLENKMHDDSKERFSSSLKYAFEFWFKDLHSSYQSMNEVYMLPKTILVIPSGAFGQLICQKCSPEYSEHGYVLSTLTPEDFSSVQHTESVSLSTLDCILVDESVRHSNQ